MRRLLCQTPSAVSLHIFDARRRRATVPDTMTKDEWDHLQKEPAPSELLRQVRSKDRLPNGVESDQIKVPGDSFGIMQNRTVFYKPVPRPTPSPELAEFFPPGIPPSDYLRPEVLRRLCSQYGLSHEYAISLFREVEGDLNAFVQTLLQDKKITNAPFGAFSLVALESYVPENFCFVNFTLPSYEATQNEDVLEAIHELVLSAAELPMDTPPQQILPKFMDWTVESGPRCEDLMASYDISATAVQLLPHGEYSAQGFAVLHPLNELGFPNIGNGAAACCLDLRTGIHNRFRFHVERMADNVSEHVLREQLHFGQDDHMLRQKYWFNPEYSVEEFLRFKENLLQPSASIFEMRYAVMLSSSYGLKPFRNIVEMEKLKIAQHKHEKHYEDLTQTGSKMTQGGQNLQSVAASETSDSFLHRESQVQRDEDTGMRMQTSAVTDKLQDSIQRHGDYALRRFYRDNRH